MEFVKYLKPTKAAFDTALFNQWEKKEISTKEAIKRFKYNNEMDIEITESEFVEWLNSLGYWR